jgi:hypothetical protein
MGEQLAIPAYDGSVFISYARIDDVQPPFDRTTLGWVTFFCENLRFELTNVGVHQADLWVDRYKIEPAEKFPKKQEDCRGPREGTSDPADPLAELDPA